MLNQHSAFIAGVTSSYIGSISSGASANGMFIDCRNINKSLLNFSCRFLNPNLNSNCSSSWKTSRNKLKKGFSLRKSFDFSLFEWIVSLISKILQIIDLQPRISKYFLTITIFSHSRLDNNENKIQIQYFSMFFDVNLIRRLHKYARNLIPRMAF